MAMQQLNLFDLMTQTKQSNVVRAWRPEPWPVRDDVIMVFDNGRWQPATVMTSEGGIRYMFLACTAAGQELLCSFQNADGLFTPWRWQ